MLLKSINVELLTLSECSELKRTITCKCWSQLYLSCTLSFYAAVHCMALFICLCCVFIFVACIQFYSHFKSNDIITSANIPALISLFTYDCSSFTLVIKQQFHSGKFSIQ